MTLIITIILAILISIILGCVYNIYSNYIYDYFIKKLLVFYNKYKINIINDSDIDYLKSIIPNDTLNNIALKILPNEKHKSPNDDILDIDLLDNSKDYGNELPWDTDVTKCNILHDIEQDLYKNVLDSHILTFY